MCNRFLLLKITSSVLIYQKTFNHLSFKTQKAESLDSALYSKKRIFTVIVRTGKLEDIPNNSHILYRLIEISHNDGITK